MPAPAGFPRLDGKSMPVPSNPHSQAMATEAALSRRLASLAARRAGGELDAAAYAAGYFLAWQTALHGSRFASRKAKADRRPDLDAWLSALDTSFGESLRATLLGWFERYHFVGVIPAVPAALLGWLRGSWSLRLLLRIPSPLEVLHLQAAGVRPVTVLAEYPRASRPVLGKANGFDFLVHDLEHAYKFFHDPELHVAQRRFFGLLRAAVERGLFTPYRSDPVFAGQLDYLISDMNTHPVHGLRYLCAVLIECLLRREGRGSTDALSAPAEAEMADLLRALGDLWRFPPTAGAALSRLRAGGFGKADAAILAEAVSRSAAGV